MIEINLRDVLDERQFYVAELSEKFGIPIKAVRHDIATNTCFEKAELLGWNAKRIIKALFFNKDEEAYGFVFPELGKENSPRYMDKKTLSSVLGITSSQAKKFRNSYCPEGMEFGTCSPFVLEDSFDKVNNGKKLKKIFIHNMAYPKGFPVDISVGGFGDKAHKTSLHLKYWDLYEILKYKFGDKIEKFNF